MIVDLPLYPSTKTPRETLGILARSLARNSARSRGTPRGQRVIIPDSPPGEPLKELSRGTPRGQFLHARAIKPSKSDLELSQATLSDVRMIHELSLDSSLSVLTETAIKKADDAVSRADAPALTLHSIPPQNRDRDRGITHTEDSETFSLSEKHLSELDLNVMNPASSRILSFTPVS